MNNIIEGMNVLEQIPIKNYSELSYIIAGLGFFIAILSVAVLWVKTISKNKEINFRNKMFKNFLFFYISGLAIIIFSIIHFPWFYVETGRYTYKCKLDNCVSANYISEHFKIIEVNENGVWTIEEK